MRLSAWMGCGLALALLFLGCAPDGGSQSLQNYDSSGQRLDGGSLPDARPNLVVVVIDSLRADAIAPVFGPRVEDDDAPVRMPFLTTLATEGIAFENVTAAAPWTLPSMMSMLTGVLPRVHGQHMVFGDWHLSSAFTTFPEILREAYGYETAIFTTGPWFERSASSLLQGFDHVRTRYALQDKSALRRWSRRRDPDRPFFLVLHTFEAHEPYGEENHPWPDPQFGGPPQLDDALRDPDLPSSELLRICALDAYKRMALGVTRGETLASKIQRYRYEGFAKAPDRELAAELEAAYWDGVSWVDGLLEKTHLQLRELGLLDNTLLVITSDHGEAFGEHDNLGHGITLYEEVIQVPLVMVGPGPFSGGRTISEQVGLIDLLPTFLDYAGYAPLQNVAGRSALSVVKGGTWCRAVITEERLSPANTGCDTDQLRTAVRTPAWKFIISLDRATGEIREEAYDLKLDPRERLDLGKGAGRLPADVTFDACTGPAVTAVRDRVWPDARSSEPEVGAQGE